MKTLLYTLSCATLILYSCQSEKNPVSAYETEALNTASAIQPIKGLEIQNRTFQIEAQKDSKIELPSGGSIEFRANSFVDKHGDLVEGEVEIQWKEYHSLTDILLSGIPMKYDSAGVKHDFVSGGMFTIKATNEGNEVDLAEGKSATVNLASYVDTPCFNFYELDEKSGDWSYETTKLGTKINEKPLEKKTPKKAKADILDLRVDLSNFPDLQKQNVVAWEAKDKLSNKFKKNLLSELNVVEAKRDNEGEYILHVKNPKTDTLIRVVPVTLSSALSQKQELLDEIEVDFKDLLEYQNNYDLGLIVRSIEIEGMGTYNWDKILIRAQQTYLAATFNLNKDIRMDFTSIFYISPKENVVIKCNSRGDTKFNFDPTLPNYLVAILPDNSVMIVDKFEFSMANDLPSGSKHQFNFTDLHTKVSTPKDLANLLKDIIKAES